MPASVAQLDARPTGDQELQVRYPSRSGNSLFLGLMREIFPTVIALR